MISPLTRLLCIFIAVINFLVLSAEKQIEVTDFFAKLYLAPNPNSKFIGLAQKGERYSIINQTGYWFRVDFRGSPAWVESTKVQVYDPDAPATNSDNSSTTGNDSTKQPVIGADSLSGESQRAVSAETKRAIYLRQQQQDSIAQSNKAKRWFSRQSLSKLPLVEQNVEKEQNDKFFLVTSSLSKVLYFLSPESPIIGMVNKGEHLKLIGEGDSWCKVSYRDTIGWIERKNGRVVTSASSPIFLNFGFLILLGGILLLIFIVVILMKVFRKRVPSKSLPVSRKKVLIIAKEMKTVQVTLTDTATTIEKCFTEIDFDIKMTPDLQALRSTFESFLPDVVLIDWKFDRTIVATIEKLLVSHSFAESMIFIVYNVPDPTSMYPSTILKNINYLGSTISDRDLFKIITPLMHSTENIQNSTQSSALEGEIAGGNLIEVLQYIEGGKKTGCLLIDTGKPYCLVYFDLGRIIYSSTFDGLIEREAVYAVLALKEGKFRFILNKKPKSSNANLSTLEVLMSWTKQLDETVRS